MDHAELRRRPAQEAPDQLQLIRVGRVERRLGARHRSQPGIELDTAGLAGEQCPLRYHAPAGDEIGAPEAVLGGGDDQAELERTQTLELCEDARDVLERADPVTETSGVLEPQVGREPPQLGPKRGQAACRLSFPAVERAGRLPRKPPAR